MSETIKALSRKVEVIAVQFARSDLLSPLLGNCRCSPNPESTVALPRTTSEKDGPRNLALPRRLAGVEPHETEMAVPLWPDELLRNRAATLKHEGQNNRALFPVPSDTPEFWQRAKG